MRNVRTRDFRRLFDALPEAVQRQAEEAFRKFVENPDHPALARHLLHDDRSGQHRPGSVSVRINHRYRAIYVPQGNRNVWYWCGSHSDYNTFTGNR